MINFLAMKDKNKGTETLSALILKPYSNVLDNYLMYAISRNNSYGSWQQETIKRVSLPL